MTDGWVTRRFSDSCGYVHATCDDHVRLSIGEEHETIIIDVADVTKCSSPWMRELAVFSGSL